VRYALPNPGGTQFQIFVDALDAGGAIVSTLSLGGSTDPASLAYVDFADSSVTLLDGGNNADGDKTAMSGDDLAWSRGSQISWLDRSDPGATPGVIDAGSRVLDVALSEANVGYTTAQTTAGKSGFSVHTGVLGAAAPLASADSEYARVFTGRNGGFLVFGGSTTTDFGAYSLASGATSRGAAVVLFGPAAPLGIDASAGRIVSVLPDGKHSPAQQQRISSDTTNDHVVPSRPSRLVNHSLDSAPPAASGGHSAYLTRPTNDSCALVVLDGTTVVTSYPVPVTCYHVTLSGEFALVSYESQYIDDTHRNPPGALLIDLDTGDRTIEPETEALSGDLLAYFAAGDVVVKNVTSGATTTVATGVVNPDPAAEAPEFVQLSLAGHWVMWSTNGSDPHPTSTGLVAEDLTTGTVVTPAATTLPPDVVENDVDAVLADGVVTWIDQATRAVHLDTLTDSGSSDAVVGTAHRYADQHQYLALTDEFVAWVANDDTTRVVPLGGASVAAPAYLGGIRATAFSPALKGAAGEFAPALDASRPLSSWTFTISRHGQTVRVLHGSAAIGDVRPRWNGRTPSGRRAPDGRYAWTLTGKGAAGTLRATSGSTRPITGRIRLDRTAPRPHVRHGRVGDRGSRLTLPVRWSCSGGPCRFTVSVEIRSTHTSHWSAAKPWIRLTSKASAVYGSGKVPRHLHAGRTYRFVVVAVDAVGNRSRAVDTTVRVSGH
jgi:hypothetical protein